MNVTMENLCIHQSTRQTYTECSVDVLQLCAHCVFFCVFLITLIFLLWKEKNRFKDEEDRRTWIRLPLHTSRWMLVICLGLCQTAIIADGILMEFVQTEPSLHLYLPSILSILTIVVSLVMYDKMEKINIYKPMITLTLYWTVAVVLLAMKVSALFLESDAGLSARFLFSLLSTVIYGFLVLVEVIVLLKVKYLCGPIAAVPPSELNTLVYIHDHTCFLSQFTWHWLSHFLAQGYNKALELKDLGHLPKNDKVEEINFKFKKIYDQEKENAIIAGRQPSLWRCYWQFSRRKILLTAVLRIIGDNLIYVGPILVEYIVLFAQDKQDFLKQNLTTQVNSTVVTKTGPLSVQSYFSNGYVLCLFVTLSTLLLATLWQNMHYLCAREGIRTKAALQSLVYDKSLRLPESALNDGQMSVGKVINHMSTDTLNIFYLFYLGQFVWTLPIQILVGLVLLYHQLGWSALLGGLMIVLLVPMQYTIGKKISHIQNEVMTHSDKRLKQSGELLHNIKLIKLYAWEALFTDTIVKTRNKELKLLLKVALFRVLSLFICDCGPVVACVMTFTLHTYWSDEPLSGSKVFSSLAIFGALSVSLFIITFVINIVSFGFVSTRRLEKYLSAGEITQPAPDITMTDLNFTNGLAPDTLKYKMSSIGSMEIQGPNTPEHGVIGNTILDAEKATLLTYDAPAVSVTRVHADDNQCVVEINGASFSWFPDKTSNVYLRPTLGDISIKIQTGELCMVCGPVGCGKSSLISAVLGEMFLVKGSLKVNRESPVAYVPQRAWLLNSSVQNNILFGRELDWERYHAVLDMCALLPDLEILPAGDQTEIGEKGVNLSGGQKQRISIARAVYSQAQFIIMDDPLSALDAPVAHHIFTKTLQNHLYKSGVTVLLVTHQLQYLDYADSVLCMNDGRISFNGKPCDLRKSEIEFLQSLEASNNVHENKNNDPLSEGADEKTGQSAGPNIHRYALKKAVSLEKRSHRDTEPISSQGELSLSQDDLVNTHHADFDVFPVNHLRSALSVCSVSSHATHYNDQNYLSGIPGDTNAAERGKLMKEEEHSTGAVGLSVYLAYARAATWVLIIVTILGYTVRQALRMLMDYWLALWVAAAQDSYLNDPVQFNVTSLPESNAVNTATVANGEQVRTLEYYVTIYLAISVSSMFVAFLGYLMLELMSLTAAKNLFNDLLHKLVKAPLRFFDTTPIGRIMNRMSGDMQIIDQKMAIAHDHVIFCWLQVLGAIIISGVATPYFLLAVVPMFVVYCVVQRFYIASSRELQRLDSITKSPILVHFMETLTGLSSIRAYKSSPRLVRKLWKAINDNTLAFLFFHTTHAWMGIRLDYLGAAIVCSASVSSLTVCVLGYISPEIVGLSISYAIMMSGFLSWAMRGISEFEMWFNSVERVGEYTHIQPESNSDFDNNADTIPNDWPTQGSIQFDNVSLRYDASLSPVIHDFSVNIKHGQKIGICGRTGSGKSSLTLSLFSLIDICQGRIIIDTQDVKRVPLDRLRSSLAIIPQDPVLFSGTIRFNLDPMHLQNDDNIWQALEVAQLKSSISELAEQLESDVSEGGENFSAGQRQLFCLARAFLRHSQILIMDEATASVDVVTDGIIQNVIKFAFSNRTVITVAHRISTIMNCDQILVIEDGNLVESDSPANLLATDSRFAAMVKQHQL